jgi:hypothetical protein
VSGTWTAGEADDFHRHLETGSRLVAYDEHFQHVPGILVESP